MPTYKKYNWFNLMDVLDEAARFGEAEQYLQDGTDIHKVELKTDTKGEFSIAINDVEIGEDFSFDEAYGIIKSCIIEEDDAI